MATGTLTPSPYQTVLDANGNPVSGAKITTYVAGTTTAATTYSDVALLVANANPIIADSSGRYVAYLSPGSSYKYVITTSAGVAVATQDNIAAVPPTSINLDVTGTAGETITAGQAVYLSDGSGSKTAGSWFKADSANTYSSTVPEIGIAPASIASGASGTVRLAGQVTGLTALVVGTTYYVGTAGAITGTAPTNRRFLGVADTTSSVVLTPNPASGWTVVTTTSTGTQDNFAPGLLGNTILRCNNASLLTIDGFTGGYDGQRVVLASIGAGQVDLAHQAAGSTAANRFINFATVGTTSLAAGSGTAEYVYDATTARWRLVSHEQGAWITRTFAAGNYTASSGNWTVASATRDAYILKGRTLTYQFNVSGTTSATPTSVKIAIPGSFTANGFNDNAAYILNNGAAAAEAGYVEAPVAAAIGVQRLGAANFSAGTVSVIGQLVIEVN